MHQNGLICPEQSAKIVKILYLPYECSLNGVIYTVFRKTPTPISEIVADIFTKFAEFTDEDSFCISCIFYSNNKNGSTDTTV